MIQAQRQGGFTLSEIMIAVTILGFIGILSYGTFANSLAARDRALAVQERYHEIRQGLSRMAREISMAYLSHHRDCDDRRSYTIFKTDSESGSDALIFNSFSHIKMRQDANESDQNEITYKIDEDPKHPSMRSLMRREANRIDEEPEEGGNEYVLVRDVEELEFQFYDDIDDDWEDDWDTEDSDYRNRLPLFVAIKIQAKNHKNEIETFSTKTEIYMRKAGSRDDALYIIGSGFTRCVD